MIIRQALFEGRIKAGQEEAFKAFVTEKMMPGWLAFPGIRQVRVLFAVERDEGAPSYPMVLSTSYESREALAVALESKQRHESRELTRHLMEMFDGHIHHHVFELAAEHVSVRD